MSAEWRVVPARRKAGPVRAPFWITKPLTAMSAEEWEALCDGCGRCCLKKLQDEETGHVHLTVVACSLLDVRTARCRDYANRSRHVPECTKITPENAAELALPDSCAYRLLALGQPLPAWHPLLTGDAGSTAAAGFSVGGRVLPGDAVADEDLEDYVVDAL